MAKGCECNVFSSSCYKNTDENFSTDKPVAKSARQFSNAMQIFL